MRIAAPSKGLVPLFVVLLLGSFAGCSGGGDATDGVENHASSRSYKGHEEDLDADNLVAAYPSLVGTRLDDCQTCHAGRIEDGKLAGSACDHCHDLLLHGAGREAIETLNPFGLDYRHAGRSEDSLKNIKNKDSDGDGFSNDEELSVQRYPGSDLSVPGQPSATLLILSLEELRAMRSHSQLMLSNTTKQQFDDYAIYKGVKIRDLLGARGISLDGATGITVIAPDGYMKSLPIELVDRVFPPPLFYSGLDAESLGPDCGLVTYPQTVPDGLADGAPVPGVHRLMLGYERNGAPLDSSRLDVERGRIAGEGPLRIVVPQEKPGQPDRGLRFSPSDCDDGFDFNQQADHNAGAMVRGVIAIRIDPMPAGVEEFDYMNGGWAYIDAGQLILYGHNVR